MKYLRSNGRATITVILSSHIWCTLANVVIKWSNIVHFDLRLRVVEECFKRFEEKLNILLFKQGRAHPEGEGEERGGSTAVGAAAAPGSRAERGPARRPAGRSAAATTTAAAATTARGGGVCGRQRCIEGGRPAAARPSGRRGWHKRPHHFRRRTAATG